jgi:hypothetical protein
MPLIKRTVSILMTNYDVAAVTLFLAQSTFCVYLFCDATLYTVLHVLHVIRIIEVLL